MDSKSHVVTVNRQKPKDGWAWFSLPSAFWMLLFIVAPIAFVVVFSFAKKGPYGGILYEFSFDNYIRALDPLYLGIFWRSIQLAASTTLICALLGFPLAFVIATARRNTRIILMTLLIVPFWTNFVVRTYALKVLFADSGPINESLLSLGLTTTPLALSNGQTMVLLGMVTNYLPFMVLPLFVTLEKFDFSILEAGRDLGASGIQNLRRLLVPLTFPGLITGSILVFTPALGEFLIPDLLGGARTMLLGNLITEQFLKMRDWPFGSALSVLLMIIVLIPLLVVLKYWGKDDRQRSQAR